MLLCLQYVVNVIVTMFTVFDICDACSVAITYDRPLGEGRTKYK